MGCGSSTNKVHIVGEAPTSNPTLNATPKHKVNSKAMRNKAMGSQDSLGGVSNMSDRIGSGTSKVSRRTMDSGFDDNERIITEHSDPNLIREVEDGFNTPRSLDLGITGQPIQQRLSAKDRERMEERTVLQKLQEEGLIQRPMSHANFGVSFEVIATGDESGNIFGAAKRPPPRLAKLEKRKKKKKPMTMEEIDQKLAQAEERRKEREQKKLERIQAVTNKSDVQNALDSFAQSQTAKEEEEQSKQDIAAENRESRLRERRDKLRAKQERIEAARRRKMAASLDDSQELPPLEESPFVSKPKIGTDDF